MTHRRKIWLMVGAAVLSLAAILLIAALVIVQTPWFANFVRTKIVATLEDSTGGVVEIGSLSIDLRHLTVRITNAVLHGKEPAAEDPLFRVREIELRVQLFSGIKKPLNFEYLGIEQPQVNLIVLPDGTTNVPEPKTPSPPSQTSGLETVVDLAVNRFELRNGLIKVLEQKSRLNARGSNLRVLLNYNTANPSYVGNLAMDPLVLASAGQPPLGVHVNVPLILEKDAIRVNQASINSAQSQIQLSAALENVNTPVINAKLNASVSIAEVQRSFALPLDANASGVPKQLTANLALRFDNKTNELRIDTARLGLGSTTLQASGDLDPTKQTPVRFSADFALAELSKLFKLTGVQIAGNLTADGRASMDKQNNYNVNGTLQSRQLSVRSGTTKISDLNVSSPFHADPYLISMDGLRVSALGGSLGAKIFLEKSRNLSVEGRLQNLAIPVLVAAFTGKQIGYDGSLSGTVVAKGDLKAKGTTSYTAQSNLMINPGRHGIPLSGQLKADYKGATGALDLANSYVRLPNSRLDLSGSLDKIIDLNLTSRNLNDFLPAANFGAAKPETTLPIVLNGGTANLRAQITGSTTSPRIAARFDINQFSVEQRPFTQLGLNALANQTGAGLQNGTLTGAGFNISFNGTLGLSKWSPQPNSPLTANVSLHNGDLADLVKLAGQTSLEASGAATAEVHVNGTYGNPLGNAIVQVNDGSVAQQPFGKFYTNVNLGDQLVTLSQFELDSAGGTLRANGTFRHPRESFSAGLVQLQLGVANIQLANVNAIAKQNAGVSGNVNLTANSSLNLQDRPNQPGIQIVNVTADLAASSLRVQNQDAGELTATARTTNGSVRYNLNSNFAGSAIDLHGSTSLSRDYFTQAAASIKNLSVEKALQLAGQSAIPANGQLSADTQVNGTLAAPAAALNFRLRDAQLYSEPINSLEGHLRYSNTALSVPSIDLDAPAGRISVSGSFNHPANIFTSGSLAATLKSSDIKLARIHNLELKKPGLAGILRVGAELSANVRQEHGKTAVLISNLNADAATDSLRVDNQPLGGLSFNAKTSGTTLRFRLDSDLAKSSIHGQGQAQLRGEYPIQGNLVFNNVRYSNIAPFVTSDQAGAPPFEALVEGKAAFRGPMTNTDAVSAQLDIDRLDFRTNQNSSPTGSPALRVVELQNNGPIKVGLDHEVVKIEQLNIGGRKTSLRASGSVNLKSADEPLSLNVAADVDLGLLQNADRDFYSSGSLALNAIIRGSFAQPRANGKIEIRSANVNYSGAPNGLSNANGVILLNGTNASIQSLTGESGGGQIALAGFVGLGSRVPSFNLKATANKVRVRYSGVSTTSNATITLTGNTRRSLLSGTVSVERIAYASSSDAGSLLSAASTPPSAPSSPSPLLAGMRLEIHILTAPDLQVATTYANRLSILANLTARGTAENPGMLGRVTVTDGQLVFFGNTYTVTTGTINFYDPNSISPILNVSLQTVAQGVNVTIGVTGPIDDMKLSYRSDPPLTFEQIVQLLATNTTPANPVIAAHQPTPPQQSYTQMGESAVLGQAVANPLASRVQRVFGLTQFKIDPSVAGANGPSARVTLQQKIASNITFTYITDVQQTNAQIVRVEWDLSNNLSAVGLRDYNGNVSIEFFYKFTRQ
ncbi:MAG TPA: translocation/assembly module TamB domain-containing protein [Bryobacteraceae bacterium]|nr:translocation/assembly module TamB domain-containing protein [Bryobacteraceae bacterium]